MKITRIKKIKLNKSLNFIKLIKKKKIQQNFQ